MTPALLAAILATTPCTLRTGDYKLCEILPERPQAVIDDHPPPNVVGFHTTHFVDGGTPGTPTTDIDNSDAITIYTATWTPLPRLDKDGKLILSNQPNGRLILPAPPCGTKEAETTRMCVQWIVQ